ncbi:hypothetical protein [Nesterenkonia populi]|uniref:hypothetical protein n=1 Tax=Nesterenkonia populi TaxID=1591087 RepID=UPI0011BD5330|nr:hypothetical protein [Nesterenkonia populi]
MDTKSSKIVIMVFPLMPVLLVATSCGEDTADTTFDGVDDLMSSMESEGLECSVMEGTTLQSGTDEVGDQVMCAEGHSLMVWDADSDADTETSENDPLVSGLEEQGAIEHLRGENWHVMSIDGELLDGLQESFGGQRNEEGFPNFAVD